MKGRSCRVTKYITKIGIAQALIGQPFDTIKVRLQSSNKALTTGECIKNLIKHEGPLAFYKGKLMRRMSSKS